MAVQSPQQHLGSIVGGRYKILAVLGQGGMGVLYTAEHMMTRRRVALKLIRAVPGACSTDLADSTARFLAEARHGAAISHPNIVDVLDMGEDADGAPFLVMELLTGTSLDRLLAERGHLSVEQTLAWMLPILGALATLHDAGIVHRDVKTSNIFLRTTPRGEFEAKLLDFGLAHSLEDPRITRSGLVMGTPQYIAPEQAAGGAVQPAADVWSMGVVLFECLSGQLPFSARDRNALAAQVLAGHVVSLGKRAPEVPTPIAYAVDRALRRDLALRYASARELAHGLVLAAQACGSRLPRDPDPLGLPEFESWVAEEVGKVSTQTAPRAAGASDQSNASAAQKPASTGARPTPASSAAGEPRHRSRKVWWGALALVLAGAVYASFGLGEPAQQHRPAASNTQVPQDPVPNTETVMKASADEPPISVQRPDASPVAPSAPAPSALTKSPRVVHAPKRTLRSSRAASAADPGGRVSPATSTGNNAPTIAPRPARPEDALKMESDWR